MRPIISTTAATTLESASVHRSGCLSVAPPRQPCSEFGNMMEIVEVGVVRDQIRHGRSRNPQSSGRKQMLFRHPLNNRYDLVKSLNEPLPSLLRTQSAISLIG